MRDQEYYCNGGIYNDNSTFVKSIVPSSYSFIEIKCWQKKYRILCRVPRGLNSLAHLKENKVVSLDVGIICINKV